MVQQDNDKTLTFTTGKYYTRVQKFLLTKIE